MRPSRLIPVAAALLVPAIAACSIDPAFLGQLFKALPLASPSASGSPLPSASPGGPSPVPSSPVTIDNLSGSWVFGRASEPPAGPFVTCNPSELWNLNESGPLVQGSVEACLGPCSAFTEQTSGLNTSGTLAMDGSAQPSPQGPSTPVTYQLKFNATTQHLVGTRNGQPFWAAPYVSPPPNTCGPRPL